MAECPDAERLEGVQDGMVEEVETESGNWRQLFVDDVCSQMNFSYGQPIHRITARMHGLFVRSSLTVQGDGF